MSSLAATGTVSLRYGMSQITRHTNVCPNAVMSSLVALVAREMDFFLVENVSHKSLSGETRLRDSRQARVETTLTEKETHHQPNCEPWSHIISYSLSICLLAVDTSSESRKAAFVSFIRVTCLTAPSLTDPFPNKDHILYFG